MDRKFVLTSLGYAIVGLALGIYMASSKNHGQLVTHAHIMLLGFVVSFVYAILHKIWLPEDTSALARVQYYLHQTGSLILFAGLFLLYGGFVGDKTLGPVLGMASVIVFVALVLMKVMFLKSSKKQVSQASRAGDTP